MLTKLISRIKIIKIIECFLKKVLNYIKINLAILISIWGDK